MSTTTKFTPNLGIPLPDLGATGWDTDVRALASKADTGLGGTATAAPDGLVDANWIGQRVYDKTNDRWYTAVATGVATATTDSWSGDGFPAGTKMLFHQASAPVGWTLATDAIDRALRLATEFVATATEGRGGDTGGTWVLSGLTHAHTHSVPVAAHKHEVPVGDNGGNNMGTVRSGSWPHGNTGTTRSCHNEFAGTQNAVTLKSGPVTDDSTGTSGAASTSAVSSDGTWRPAYSNVIIATKD